MKTRMFVWAALVAVIFAVWGALTATAQEPKAGPFVIKNTSGKEAKFTDLVYTDRAGIEQKLGDAVWIIKAGDYTRLTTQKGESIVATKVKVNLVTEAGTTTLTWTSVGVDTNGNMVCLLQAADIDQHLRLLGKAPAAPPVVALKPSADDAATRERAAAREAGGGRCRASRRTFASPVTAFWRQPPPASIAKLAYDRADPGSTQEKLAAATYYAADIALTGLQTALRQQEAALQAARNRLNSMP